MLPVPMLPMANGAGAEARWGFAGVEARHPECGRPRKPATPNEARHPDESG